MYTTYSICTAISSEKFFKYKINITYKYSGVGGGGGGTVFGPLQLLHTLLRYRFYLKMDKMDFSGCLSTHSNP